VTELVGYGRDRVVTNLEMMNRNGNDTKMEILLRKLEMVVGGDAASMPCVQMR
jgi:hypothetical protein